MSWSEYLPDVSPNELAAYVPNEHTQQFRDQFDQARGLALVLIDSGVVGEGEDLRFVVSMSGHGNPEHKPTPGWANDFVSVSVTQK